VAQIVSSFGGLQLREQLPFFTEFPFNLLDDVTQQEKPQYGCKHK
jgi:hypothetical protein